MKTVAQLEAAMNAADDAFQQARANTRDAQEAFESACDAVIRAREELKRGRLDALEERIRKAEKERRESRP